MSEPTNEQLAKELTAIRNALRDDLSLAELDWDGFLTLAALTAALSEGWKDMKDDPPPKDGTEFLVWAPSVHGLPSMFSVCAWHEDAGFCIDELREATHWRPLPSRPPQEDK